MESLIVIRPADAQHWQWCRADGRDETGTLDSLAQWMKRQQGRVEVVLLVPGEQVLLCEVDMPTSTQAHIPRALPFALEDDVIDDPEELHCVAGPWLGPQRLSAAVVRRSDFSQWLSDLASIGIEPARAVPDSLCLPWQDTEIHLQRESGRALLRWGECRAMAIENDMAEDIVQMVTSGQPGTPMVLVQHDDTGLAGLAAASASSPINLMQGEFLPATDKAGWPRWRLPAALAGVFLLLAVAVQAVSTWQMQGEANRLAEKVRSQFEIVFPEVRRIQTDPGPQIQAGLRELHRRTAGGNDDFVFLLQQVAPVMAGSQDLVLESLRYRDGLLELGLSADELARIDGLRLRLRSAGLTAEQGATRLEGERVSGTLSIRNGAAP